MRKLGNCESLAKLYAHLFSRKIAAFEECNVDIDDEGSLPADDVLNEQEKDDDADLKTVIVETSDQTSKTFKSVFAGSTVLD